jgi:hypothetical protein
VRSTAPYLLSRDINIGEGEDGSLVKEERYCKDHAGRICQVGGFYWRGGAKSVWVDFGGQSFVPDVDHDSKEMKLMLRVHPGHTGPADADFTTDHYGKQAHGQGEYASRRRLHQADFRIYRAFFTPTN